MKLEISLCIAYAVTALISWQYCRMRLGYVASRPFGMPSAVSMAVPAPDRFQRQAPTGEKASRPPGPPAFRPLTALERDAWIPERKDTSGLRHFLRLSLRRHAAASRAGATGPDWSAGDCWPKDPAGYRWLVWAGRSE